MKGGCRGFPPHTKNFVIFFFLMKGGCGGFPPTYYNIFFILQIYFYFKMKGGIFPPHT